MTSKASPAVTEVPPAAPTLAVCISTFDPGAYRATPSYSSLALSKFDLGDDLEIVWLGDACGTADVARALAGVRASFVLFVKDSHTFSAGFVPYLVKALKTTPRPLVDVYHYADTIPMHHNPAALTPQYHYRRDTDIWGAAFSTQLLADLLQTAPGLDRQAIYVSYRAFYGIKTAPPLAIGYSSHDDTKIVNGIVPGPPTTHVVLGAVTSAELRLYAAKLLINLVRGLQDGRPTALHLADFRQAASDLQVVGLDDIIPPSDRIEYHALRYLVSPSQATYCHKRLGHLDALIGFTTGQPPADAVMLYTYRFADETLSVYKTYATHAAPASPAVVDAYRRPITEDSLILFYDRTTQAGDNAEALYRYFREHFPAYKNAYFALSPKSGDWPRLALEGFRLVPIFTPEFHDRFVHSDLVVSSQIYNTAVQGKDFSNSRFVYLQHGVMMNDMRQWIVSKCFDLFVATGEPEAAYLRTMAPNEVINCGIPRLETLERVAHTGTNLVLMPTWRFNLGRVSAAAFTRSQYFTALATLMTDSALLDYLDRRDGVLKVKLHPNSEKRLPLFPASARVIPTTESYQSLTSQADFILTDYSSAVLDGAFLGVPIAYYAFDRDIFFAEQPYTERMDYETEGLGPVFTHHAHVVDYVTTDAYRTPDPVYVERRAAFFAGVPVGSMRSSLVQRMLAL